MEIKRVAGLIAALLFAAVNARARATVPGPDLLPECAWVFSSREAPIGPGGCSVRIDVAVKTNAPCAGEPPSGFVFDAWLQTFIKKTSTECGGSDGPPWVSGVSNYDAALHERVMTGRDVAACPNSRHSCWTRPDGTVCDLTVPSCFAEHGALQDSFDPKTMTTSITPADARAAVNAAGVNLSLRTENLNWLRTLSSQNLELWLREALGPGPSSQAGYFNFGQITGLSRAQFMFVDALTRGVTGIDLSGVSFSNLADAAPSPTTTPTTTTPTTTATTMLPTTTPSTTATTTAATTANTTTPSTASPTTAPNTSTPITLSLLQDAPPLPDEPASGSCPVGTSAVPTGNPSQPWRCVRAASAAAAAVRASDNPAQWPQARGSDGRSYPIRVADGIRQIYIGGRWRALSGDPPGQWIEINGRRIVF